MKKLMIAAAVAMVAVCSQAMTVKWSTGLLNGPVDGTSGAVGTTGFNNMLGTWTATLYVYDTAGAEVTSDVLEMTVYKNTAGSTRRSVTSKSGGTAKWDNAAGMYVSTSLAKVLPSEGEVTHSYQWKIVVEGKLDDGRTATKETALQPAYETPGASGGATFAGGTIDGWANQSWTVTGGSVPEPTSGLLLLLGVAGLALRRRRA